MIRKIIRIDEEKCTGCGACAYACAGMHSQFMQGRATLVGCSRLDGDHAPLLAPYSVYTPHTNGRFSHEKASRLLGYRPRGIVESIRDSL